MYNLRAPKRAPAAAAQPAAVVAFRRPRLPLQDRGVVRARTQRRRPARNAAAPAATRRSRQRRLGVAEAARGPALGDAALPNLETEIYTRDVETSGGATQPLLQPQERTIDSATRTLATDSAVTAAASAGDHDAMVGHINDLSKLLLQSPAVASESHVDMDVALLKALKGAMQGSHLGQCTVRYPREVLPPPWLASLRGIALDCDPHPSVCSLCTIVGSAAQWH